MMSALCCTGSHTPGVILSDTSKQDEWPAAQERSSNPCNQILNNVDLLLVDCCVSVLSFSIRRVVYT